MGPNIKTIQSYRRLIQAKLADGVTAHNLSHPVDIGDIPDVKISDEDLIEALRVNARLAGRGETTQHRGVSID
jgi:hypothetical protein